MSHIEVEDIPAPKAEVVIPEAKASGWFGMYRTPHSFWMQVPVEFDPHGTKRDMHRCPYPLHVSRESLIAEASKAMPAGGDLRIFRIEL